MPALNPSQLHQLVQDLLPNNNNNLIDPAEVRQVLDTIIDSVYNLIATPNPTAPSLANVLTEGNQSGANDLLMTTGRYLVFRDGLGNQVRVRPVQQSVGASLPKDIVLPARSGTIALQEDIAASSWLKPVANQVQQPTGAEAVGTRYLVAIGATGPFAGKAGWVAERGASDWVFQETQNGDMVRCTADPVGVIRVNVSGVWVAPTIGGTPALEAVLAMGNRTGAYDIGVDAGQKIHFRDNASSGVLSLSHEVITADNELLLPNKSGVIAVLSDIAAGATPNLEAVLAVSAFTGEHSITVSMGQAVIWQSSGNEVPLSVSAPPLVTPVSVLLPSQSGTLALVSDIGDQRLRDVLVNGNETLGRSVQISENDGVNWLQGANYVRVKAPAVVGAPRNITWPDKDGVIATTDDVSAASAGMEPAVAAGTSSQYYRGDKTWQSLASAVAATPAVAANTAKVTNATHTGDVTGSTALTIGANKVTNAKAAQMPANTLKGNNTGAAANQADLTVAQTKVMLALDAVDNTSDANKPVSTAQAAALAFKAPLASPALTGTPTAPTAPAGTNNTQVATTAYADAAVAAAGAASGHADLRGTISPAGAYPSTGGSGAGGAVMRGNRWVTVDDGIIGSLICPAGTFVEALVDAPGQVEANWLIDAPRAMASNAEAGNRGTTDVLSVLSPVSGWYLADMSVSMSPLTGLATADTSPVVAADTTLSAFGKLEASLRPMVGARWHRCKLDQAGTAAPTAISKVGTLGATATARTSAGEYTITAPAGSFVANKTRVYISNGHTAAPSFVQAAQVNGTTIGIRTWNASGVLADGLLTDASIYIVVEP